MSSYLRRLTIIGLLFAFAIIDANASSSLESIKAASGDTPVDFVDCEDPRRGCQIVARFADMQLCDKYRALFHTSCRSTARPGFFICQRFDRPREAVHSQETYCIPAL